MNIAPVSLNLFSKITLSPAFGASNEIYRTKDIKDDVFVKRDDKYAKAYKKLVQGAYEAERAGAKTPLKSSDIKFLLDIRDYNKFRNVIETPVEIERFYGTDKLNIFFFTDADATRQLAKRINKNGGRKLLKELLMQQRGYKGQNVFHEIAENDDVKKAYALKDNLSIKEFKRFLKSRNDYQESPYSIAQEKNNNMKKLIEPLFVDGSLNY